MWPSRSGQNSVVCLMSFGAGLIPTEMIRLYRQPWQIRASFCNEYILVHAWLRNEDRMSCKAQIFALFSMATKIWQKVDMPFSPIHVGSGL